MAGRLRSHRCRCCPRCCCRCWTSQRRSPPPRPARRLKHLHHHACWQQHRLCLAASSEGPYLRMGQTEASLEVAFQPASRACTAGASSPSDASWPCASRGCPCPCPSCLGRTSGACLPSCRLGLPSCRLVPSCPCHTAASRRRHRTSGPSQENHGAACHHHASASPAASAPTSPAVRARGRGRGRARAWERYFRGPRAPSPRRAPGRVRCQPRRRRRESLPQPLLRRCLKSRRPSSSCPFSSCPSCFFCPSSLSSRPRAPCRGR
mmetsp:Transcript_59063/g.169617  ORF Transcript_59063/g.169617 Transcript_59063/m.169617 type:complete len:264 (+) Transcript_59063:619-1410(+)